MAKLNTEIPDDLEIRIQRLVDEGEFLTYEEAVQELISSGLTAYRTNNEQTDDYPSEFEDEFDTAEPAGHDDEYVF